MSDEIIKLGDEHSVRILRANGSDIIEAIIESHTSDITGQSCGGIIPIGKDDWTVHQENPLTVYPSINCDRCSSHYTIVAGTWVDNRTEIDYAKWTFS